MANAERNIQIAGNNIFVDGLKVGFFFKDPDEKGKVFCNITGACVREFNDKHKAKRWVVRHVESLVPTVRDWLLAHVEHFPKAVAEARYIKWLQPEAVDVNTSDEDEL